MTAESSIPAPSVPTDATARFKIGLVVVKSVGSAILGVLMGTNWTEMSRQQQFMAVIAIVVNACVALEALYDKTMTRRADGKAAALATGKTPPPFGGKP